MGGDLEPIENQAGPARVEAGADDCLENLADRDLDGGGILKERESKIGPDGVFGFRAVRLCVEVAEGRVAQSGGAALDAVAFDVATLMNHFRLPTPPTPPGFSGKFLMAKGMPPGVCRKIFILRWLRAKY